MKFLIFGDLHGNKPIVHFKDFDSIIATGDFCSSDKIRDYAFQALRKKFQDSNSKPVWYDLISKKKAIKIIKKSLRDGRKILEYLNSFGIPVYIVPGNADFVPSREEKWSFLRKNYYKRLKEGLENIIDVHHKLVSNKRYLFIGHGISSGPEYPQYKQDLKKLSKEELEKKKSRYKKDFKRVDSLFSKATKPTIFLSHNVPFKTQLDKIIDEKSPRHGYHFGSLISRKMIEKYQPLVCVGGHMHENFGKCKIGKTVCINAGLGFKSNILLEIENSKIITLKFYEK